MSGLPVAQPSPLSRSNCSLPHDEPRQPSDRCERIMAQAAASQGAAKPAHDSQRRLRHQHIAEIDVAKTVSEDAPEFLIILPHSLIYEFDVPGAKGPVGHQRVDTG